MSICRTILLTALFLPMPASAYDPYEGYDDRGEVYSNDSDPYYVRSGPYEGAHRYSPYEGYRDDGYYGGYGGADPYRYEQPYRPSPYASRDRYDDDYPRQRGRNARTIQDASLEAWGMEPDTRNDRRRDRAAYERAARRDRENYEEAGIYERERERYADQDVPDISGMRGGRRGDRFNYDRPAPRREELKAQDPGNAYRAEMRQLKALSYPPQQ